MSRKFLEICCAFLRMNSVLFVGPTVNNHGKCVQILFQRNPCCQVWPGRSQCGLFLPYCPIGICSTGLDPKLDEQ